VRCLKAAILGYVLDRLLARISLGGTISRFCNGGSLDPFSRLPLKPGTRLEQTVVEFLGVLAET